MGSQSNVAGASTWLYQFGEGLKCPDHYRHEGNRLAQNVFKALQSLPQYSVPEVYIVGSIGKKTDVITADLDLTLVVNDEKPPFTRVLDDIEKVVKANYKSLEINLHQGFKKTDRYCQFQFNNGIDVELFPAANFPDEEIKAKIRQDPRNNSRIFCSSLPAKQKAFMASQDGFTHTLVRLAKFWFKSLHFREKVHGGSTMIEIIATAAAYTSENNCIINGWMTFINLIFRLHNLKIAFEETRENVWVLVSESRLCNRNPNLVPKVIGERNMLDYKCFVIDPTNPFDDYLFGKKKIIGKLRSNANVAKQRLNSLLQRGALKREVFIATLFKPQPRKLINLYPNAHPQRIVLTCGDPYQSIFGKVEIRNENLFKNVEIQLLVEALRANLVSVIHTYFYMKEMTMSGKKKPKQTRIGDLVNKINWMIGANLQIHDCVSNVSKLSYMHDVMSVTIIVPYEIDDNICAVRLSLGW